MMSITSWLWQKRGRNTSANMCTHRPRRVAFSVVFQRRGLREALHIVRMICIYALKMTPVRLSSTPHPGSVSLTEHCSIWSTCNASSDHFFQMIITFKVKRNDRILDFDRNLRETINLRPPTHTERRKRKRLNWTAVKNISAAHQANDLRTHNQLVATE